jgi:chemotaxis protein CheD
MVMLASETMVRMGELAVSRASGDVLVSIGLGSCIGLALVDRARSVAGLAHVMLPESTGTPEASNRMKFADQAVPALVEQMVALGASVNRLEAVLVGGARMFSLGGSSLDIGARNERATLEQLAERRIRVIAKATSGTRGRTIRVHVESGLILCKEAGGTEAPLLGGTA